MSREKGVFAAFSKSFAFNFFTTRDIIIITLHTSGEIMMNIIEIDNCTYCLSFVKNENFCDFSSLSNEIFARFGKKLSEKSNITAYKSGGHFLVFISDTKCEARISDFCATLIS